MTTPFERKTTEIIGNYTVVTRPKIGQGTFGQVCKATHNVTKKPAAMKEIYFAQSGRVNQEMYDMAQRELNILRNLQTHRNIVDILEYRIERDSFFLFMDYCDQGNLKEYLLEHKDLVFDPRVKIMLESTGAIAFMHRQEPPILHRDIKPENILIKAENGEHVVKVVDFGLSKICEQQLPTSLSEVFVPKKYLSTACGSNFYQAPEFFAEAEGGLKYDASVDVFALGLVHSVVLQHGIQDTEILPLSINSKRSKKVISIGKEMVENYRKNLDMPVVVEYKADDDFQRKWIKKIILYMTKFKNNDRKNIQEAEEDFRDLYGMVKHQLQNKALPGISSTDEKVQPIKEGKTKQASPEEKESVPVEQHMNWFHPFLSGENAYDMVLDSGKDNCFVVRYSGKQPKNFVLTVANCCKVRHIVINRNDQGKYTIGNTTEYDTLKEFIYGLNKNGPQTSSDLSTQKSFDFLLIRYVFYVDSGVDIFFHGYLPAKDANQLLLSDGRLGSFLLWLPTRSPEHIVLSVFKDTRKMPYVANVKIHCHSDGIEKYFNVAGPGAPKFKTLLELIEHYTVNPMVETNGKIIELKSPLFFKGSNPSKIKSRTMEL